jgi:hypothetical protein
MEIALYQHRCSCMHTMCKIILLLPSKPVSNLHVCMCIYVLHILVYSFSFVGIFFLQTVLLVFELCSRFFCNFTVCLLKKKRV